MAALGEIAGGFQSTTCLVHLGSLGRQAEEPILALRQAEARQGERIDLLPCQIRRQLTLQSHYGARRA
ncbi:hypothetical protein CJU00_31830 [Pseudomonas aeruginosa]|nr:hypothetical protein CJU00_31830 [Pseudomonas aeruginosa]